VDSTSNTTCYTYGLLRHGETVWNSEKRVQGHGNSPLTPRGRATTAQWALFLADGGWQHILCSDLGRVRETAQIINEVLQLPVTEDARLREQNWGDWEGLRVDDVRRDFAVELSLMSAKGWDFRPPHGESRREVRDRAFAALAAYRSTHPAGKTLVICHLGVIKCLVYGVAGCSFLPDDNIMVEKGCLHHILDEQGIYRLGPLNISQGAAL
jgi:probable phosphoglycerate mutase